MSYNNYRHVGVRGNCCGICQFNQFDRNRFIDACLKNSDLLEIEEDDVCDLFELQPDSTILEDVQAGDELELNIDEPYRGNVYAGPYTVHSVFENGFTYMVKLNSKDCEIHKFAPLRGYKKVNNS